MLVGLEGELLLLPTFPALQERGREGNGREVVLSCCDNGDNNCRCSLSSVLGESGGDGNGRFGSGLDAGWDGSGRLGVASVPGESGGVEGNARWWPIFCPF